MALSLLLSPLSTFPTSAKEVEHYIAVVKGLEKSFDERRDDDQDPHRTFLRALAVLASDFLTAGCDLLHATSQFQSLHRAVRTLTDYIVAEIHSGCADDDVSGRDLLHAFSAFCSGTPSLEKAEQAQLVGILSEAKRPEFVTIVNSSVDIEDLDEFAQEHYGEAPASSQPSGDLNRPQTDLTLLLLNQFLTPIDKDANTGGQEATSSALGSSTVASAAQAATATESVSATQRLSVSGGGNSVADSTNTDFGNRSRLVRSSFAAKNVQYMHRRNVGDVLIDLCSNLPQLSSFIRQWNDATSGEGISCVPASFGEAASHRQTYGQLVQEISTTWRALTIPVLEPLTAERTGKVCQIVMGCLLASVSVATTQSIIGLQSGGGGSGSLCSSSGSGSSTAGALSRLNSGSSGREEELDFQAVEIIEKSLELLNSMMSLVRESTRAGGHVLQNFTTMAAWVLVTGMLVQFTNTSQVADKKESKGSQKESTPPSRVNLPKAQQGFGVLSVALASQALTLTASLLDDLSSEIAEVKGASGEEEESTSRKIEPANFDLFFPFTATQRVALIFDSVPFIQLLFNMAIISYKKSCNLKCLLGKVQKVSNQARDKKGKKMDVTGERRAPTISLDEIEEDSYSEDDEDYPGDAVDSSHEDDDDDEDSEPLLGKWFEETLLPQGEANMMTAKEALDREDEKEAAASDLLQDGGNGLHVPDKGEPAGFISLASHIFLFLDKHMLATDSSYVKDYLSNRLSEQQMIVLATIIQDLDRDTGNSLKLEYHLASLYSEFSAALASFTHNVLAHGLLTTKLQNSLLSHLNVSPWQTEGADWPLRVFPRTLAVLAQVLLLRQSQDGGGGLYASKQTNVYIVIWGKILSSLTRLILSPAPEASADSNEFLEDLNVEHVQLSLFLFHALALMQKKQVLLMTASNICKIAEMVNSRQKLTTGQIMHISRLVLFFEYLMRNLYEPPRELMEQVQSNIFKKYQNTSVLSGNPPNHFAFKEKGSLFGVQDSKNANPRFYNLFAVTDVPSIQEIPKLDGLACSFLLGTTDMLYYGEIYHSLIKLLQVIHQSDLHSGGSGNEAISATQYCFSIVWRVLQSLPPSVEFLEGLVSPQATADEAFLSSPCTMLHTLILCPRTGHKVLSAWIKDSLVKQGQTTAKAENLIKNVSTTINRLSYDVKMFERYVTGLSSRKNVFTKAVTDSPIDQTPEKKILLSEADMPDFVDLLLYDTILSKVQISMDMLINAHKRGNSGSGGGGGLTSDNNVTSVATATEHLPETIQAMHDLGPMMARLIETFTLISKSYMINDMKSSAKSKMDDFTMSALLQLCGINGSYSPTTNTAVLALNNSFPPSLQNSVQDWNEASIVQFPPASSWRTSSGSASSSSSSPPIELLPYEVYINLMIKSHTSGLTGPLKRNLKSLKHCLYSTLRFAEDLYVSCPELPDLQARLSSALFPVLMDVSTESWADRTMLTLQSPAGSEKLTAWTYTHFLESTFGVLLDAGALIRAGCFDESLVRQIVQFMDSMLDEQEGREALDKFFNKNEFQLVKVLLTSSSLSPEYASKVLTFFNHLFEASEKSPKEASTSNLCSSLSGLAKIPSTQLELWLGHLVQGSLEGGEHLEPSQMAAVYDNRALLQSLSRYIVREETQIPEDVALSILKCLLPMGAKALNPSATAVEGLGFGDLIAVMKTLAGAGSGVGHVQLFRECAVWLESCKNYIVQKNVIEKLEEGVGSGKHVSMVENACHLLNYVSQTAVIAF